MSGSEHGQHSLLARTRVYSDFNERPVKILRRGAKKSDLYFYKISLAALEKG